MRRMTSGERRSRRRGCARRVRLRRRGRGPVGQRQRQRGAERHLLDPDLVRSSPCRRPEGQCRGPPAGDGRRGPGPDGRHGPDQDPRRHHHPGPPGPGSGPVRRAERLGRATRRLRHCSRPSTCPPRPSSFRPVSVDGFTYQARTYGVPFATENLALFRNTDLAPEAPESIDVMARDGLELKDKDDQILPIALPVGPQGDAYHWYPFYSAAGGKIFGLDAQGGYTADELEVGKPGSIEAAKRLAQLTEDGALDKDDHCRRCPDRIHLGQVALPDLRAVERRGGAPVRESRSWSRRSRDSTRSWPPAARRWSSPRACSSPPSPATRRAPRSTWPRPR